jgi:hypothetical protein
MPEPDKRPVTMEELLISSLAQTDALAKLLIEKGLIMQKTLEERATYLNSITDYSKIGNLKSKLSGSVT